MALRLRPRRCGFSRLPLAPLAMFYMHGLWLIGSYGFTELCDHVSLATPLESLSLDSRAPRIQATSTDAK